MKRRGFWVGIRIQPVVDASQVIKLIENTTDIVDFFTIEHLKISQQNPASFESVYKLIQPFRLECSLESRGEFEFPTAYKLANIERFRQVSTKPIGCGDNDLHILSDSLNCCGIDLMPPAFRNWMKYNSMYIKMTGDRSQWYPKCDCTGCFNSARNKKDMGFSNVKDYTDFYYRQEYGEDTQLTLFDT